VRKVFEVDAVLCVKCGGEMKLTAIILDDSEFDRIPTSRRRGHAIARALEPRPKDRLPSASFFVDALTR